MTKKYFLSAEQLQPIAEGYGSCIASDLIVVEGEPVGYMYREEPELDHDSGWRFFSGGESQAYADDPTHFAFYDVNTVANHSPSIVALLNGPVGSAFERDEAGNFVEMPFPDEPED